MAEKLYEEDKRLGEDYPWYRAWWCGQHVRVPVRSKYAHDPALIALGFAIRLARQEKGVSQERLALETGIDRSYMGAIERGEQNTGVVHLCKIATALGTPVSAFFVAAGL